MNARVMNRSSFTGWVQRDAGKVAQITRLFSRTFGGIEREIAQPGYYGATILVLEHDTISDVCMLHAYRIRRGKWAGQYSDTGKVYPYRADKLFALPVKSFEPAEPWRVTRGCDVVGLDPVLTGVRLDSVRGIG